MHHLIVLFHAYALSPDLSSLEQVSHKCCGLVGRYVLMALNGRERGERGCADINDSVASSNFTSKNIYAPTPVTPGEFFGNKYIVHTFATKNNLSCILCFSRLGTLRAKSSCSRARTEASLRTHLERR